MSDANEDIRIIHGDAVEVMRTLPDASVDAIISDPIYPEISREYGRISEADWHVLMRGVVGEARRALKPHGSAVFILQPNSERVGRMRPWLWEFMAWTAREWNMVQDFWWWNIVVAPNAHCRRDVGLARPSVKACVWLGSEDCFRCQDEILWTESQANAAKRKSDDARRVRPSGVGMRNIRCSSAAVERGGVTPFNLIPMANTNSSDSAGTEGHGAGTPFALADWWTRYITRPGDTILDPFSGSGTMPLAAQARGRKAIGIERDAGYVEISRRRIESAKLPMFDRVPEVVPQPAGIAPAPAPPPMFAFASEGGEP